MTSWKGRHRATSVFEATQQGYKDLRVPEETAMAHMSADVCHLLMNHHTGPTLQSAWDDIAKGLTTASSSLGVLDGSQNCELGLLIVL